ncbi:MAG: c-type cytochrome [Burkholderiaceae bacterium]|nr:c-type cytochrome [Burkholderiaceae bacterium]
MTRIPVLLLSAMLAVATRPATAQDLDRAEQLFSRHCAVCHGADRGGYIGPALNRDETKLSRGQVAELILSGSPATLMPQHPNWRGTLSAKDRDLLARLVTTQPRRELSWSLDDARKSLEVLVSDESKLPSAPRYSIDRIDDLMAVMSRGRQAVGAQAKVLFFDGRTHRKVGEVRTGHAPHLMDFHPTQPRWAYVRDDLGWVHKIDLYSMRTVRKVRAGLNGTSLAVSRDGRYVAAGSFVPHTLVLLDADTLEPVHLLELRGVDPDGRTVSADSGMITATSFANVFVVALEQAGQVWIIDLDRRGFPFTAITKVGRHLHDAFLSPDGRYVVVASYDDHENAVIDLQEKRVVRRIPAGCKPHVGSGAVVRSKGRLLGFGTNIGEDDCKSFEVTVFDMDTFDVVERIPVIGPTESPAAHPNAPYVVVDIVGKGPNASKLQFIDKETLQVVRTLDVAGTLTHSNFPEYTARGDFFYVSARYSGDRSMGAPAGRLVVFDSRTLAEVKSIPVDVPAGVFSAARARTVVVGLQPPQ